MSESNCNAYWIRLTAFRRGCG
ncbi:Protein of unknown function [Pyronema omphalodes CBS 100304]|uniref:Uncharacterized protein n=1 Tax=Pyronema omphalodes (strain CBS 100304) TaxID=1076935 RepID=U4LDA4_PYROM|nr:Protein of unknown function [Pyronema omphalodes CBS 100304]